MHETLSGSFDVLDFTQRGREFLASTGDKGKAICRFVCFLALFALLQMPCALSAASPASPQGPVARIASGSVEGVFEGAVAVWRGIPYAAAPVGELRWRAPKPAQKFEGVRIAREFGASCPQIADSPTQLSPLGLQNEDCLFLNIWAPASALQGHGKLPVMVWLHGGGFIAGAGSEAQFDGTAFANQGVVLVTLNYRLGRLGFFAHPALAAEAPEEPQGNYGLLDQIAALHWVQSNIPGFGGDPDNVTLFGESAGAISAVALATSPMAQGLFHKMIVQSAPLRPSMRDMRGSGPDLPSAETLGKEWATSLGIAGDDADALAALRSLPVGKIAPAAASSAAVFAIIASSGPMADGKLLSGAPAAAYATGRQMAVPMIVGSNGREDVVWSFDRDPPGLVPITPLTGPQILAQVGDPGKREKLEEHYRAKVRGDMVAADVALRSDAFAGASAYFLARTARAPVWLYRFDAVPPQVRDVVAKAPHGMELFYTFGTLDRFPYRAEQTSKGDRATSAALVRYWTSFARTGKPSARNAPLWQAFDKERPAMLHVSNSGMKQASFGDAWALDALIDTTLR